MSVNYSDFSDSEPIYIQIAEWLENKIVTGQLKEDEQIPSTTELSVSLKINPATIRKGVNILVDKGLVYKKRGMGMYVAKNANENVLDDRKVRFYDDYIAPLLAEAHRLGLEKKDIIEMLKGDGDR
ncbi:GntR family transcriptional regulator [Ruminococcus sp. HUN007]|uniref:GntR family transcriptional regulator n=1 Tax=Ruminococcus sp. HUN007 TaxID=1514668 RepID=UPI0005D1C965|nr:GntR family transcriptional regulator [Ruminococcus sp. HUN007]